MDKGGGELCRSELGGDVINELRGESELRMSFIPTGVILPHGHAQHIEEGGRVFSGDTEGRVCTAAPRFSEDGVLAGGSDAIGR